MVQSTKAMPESVELFAKLEERSYNTFKARIKAYERLQQRSRAWNTALISLATATTVAAVGILVDDTMYGSAGNAFLVVCSILSLAASLVISSLDYPGRAVRMDANYKEVQDIAYRAELARRSQDASQLVEYQALYEKYSELLRHSENHTTADHLAYIRKWSHERAFSAAVTLLPYIALILPVLITLKFALWVADGFS